MMMLYNLVCFIAPIALLYALAMIVGLMMVDSPCWQLGQYVC